MIVLAGTRDPGFRRLLFAALLLALVTRVAGSSGKELWLDELHSAAICSQPIATWIEPGALGGYTPLYFIVSAPFSRMGGDFAAKVISILSGTLLLLAVPRLLGGASGSGGPGSPSRHTLGLGLVLTAMAPSLIVFSSYHRMYALYALLVTAAWIAWGIPGRTMAILTVILSCSAFLTFPNASLYVGALALYAIMVRRHRGRALVSVIIVALLGWLWSAQGLRTILAEPLSREAPVHRFPGITPSLYLQQFKFLIAGPIGVHHPYLKMLALPLMALSLVSIADGAWRAAKGDRVRFFLVHAVLLPPLAEFVLLAAGIRMFQFKSYLPSALPLLMLVALFLGERARPGARRLATTGAVLVFASFAVISATWIDPAQPFSMNESRGDRQYSLLEYTSRIQPAFEDASAPLPLVLADPSALLGALRYQPTSPRKRFADGQLFRALSVPGRYRDLIMTIVRDADITILDAAHLPSPAFWVGQKPPPGPHEVATTSEAGLAVYVTRPDSAPATGTAADSPSLRTS